MSFESLPADWPTIPLTDPDHIADVLDIVVSRRDRMVGSLLILICDEQRRPVQPVVIADIDRAWPDDGLDSLRRIADMVAGMIADATVLCAVARRGKLRVTQTDRRWQRLVEQAFADRVELLGIHLVTLDGTMPISTPSEQAA